MYIYMYMCVGPTVWLLLQRIIVTTYKCRLTVEVLLLLIHTFIVCWNCDDLLLFLVELLFKGVDEIYMKLELLKL